MIKNYILTAFRNIKRYKGYSFLNILGLSIGLTSAILILLWVLDEIRYDKFNEKYEQIHRVILLDETYKETRSYSVTPPALAEAMQNNFPEILKATKFDTDEGHLISLNKDKIKFNLMFAEQSLFDIFSFNFKKGNPSSALSNINSIVISETIANKMFGSEDPINKIVRIDNQYDFKVTSVIEDIPSNSSVQFEALISFENIEKMVGISPNTWETFGFQTYLLLDAQTNIAEFNHKIADFVIKSHTYTWTPKIYVQPLNQIHLYDINGGGPIIYIYIFSFIAAFILLLACINFMNLTTARTSIRSKEIGLRKVVGATKWKLLLQFYGESILTSVLAMFLSIILVFSLLPIFNELTGKTLSLYLINSYEFYFIVLGITILTGIIAGSYPAVYLSSLQPIKTLKDSHQFGSYFIRKVLVIFQFSLSIILITATIIVSNQMHFIRNQNLGFNKDQIVIIPLNHELHKKYEVVINEFQQNQQILSVCAMSSKIGLGRLFSTDVNKWDGNNGEKALLLSIITTSHDFLKTFDMKMKEGRFFSKEFPSDSNTVILNEAAVKEMGLSNPIGKNIYVHDSKIPVLGVVNDFNFQSLKSNIKPLALFIEPESYKYIAVKVRSSNIASTLDFIREKTESIAPSFPFEYQFLDEEFDNLYRTEQSLSEIFNYFSILAMIISSLGLFGLASYLTEKRTKEVGIRKVMGASVFQIIFLLSKEFTRWVLLANIIAWPVAYYFMNNWLQEFAYRVNITFWPFLLSGFIALLIALITVSYQSIKVALSNPSESIRYE